MRLDKAKMLSGVALLGSVLVCDLRAQESAPAPQEAATEVEDLLRGFEEGLEDAPELPGLGPDLLGFEDAPPPAIHLYRSSDAVDLIRAGEKRSLYYWDSHVELQRGDEVHQSEHSRTLLDFPGGSHLRIDGLAVIQVRCSAEDEEFHLSVPLMRKHMLLQLEETPLQVDLPGGNQLRGQQTHVTVRERELRALRIRNTGPGELEIRGPYLGDEVLVLPGGQEVFMPLMDVVAMDPGSGSETLTVAGEGQRKVPMTLQYSPQVQVSQAGGTVQLAAPGTHAEVVRVSGSRLTVQPGAPLRIRRAPLGRLIDQE